MFQQLLHRASHHGLIWLGVPTEYQRRMFSQGNISPSTMPNSYETICALESMRASGQELPVVVVDANIAKRDRHCLAKTMDYLDDFSDLELILFGDQPSVKNRNLYRHVISSNSSFISGLDVVLPNDESVNSEPESDSASERVLLLENNSTRRLIAQGLLRSLSIEHDIMDDVPSFLDKDSYDVLLMSYEMLDLPGASELLKLANRAVIMGGEEQSDFEYIGIPLREKDLLSLLLSKKTDLDDINQSKSDPNVFDLNDDFHINVTEIQSRLGVSDDIVTLVLNTYLTDLDQQLEKLQQAILSKTPKELKSIAHLIKGAASTVAVHELSQLAAALEKQVNSEIDSPQVSATSQELAEKLNSLLETVKVIFQQYCHRDQGNG